MSVREQSFSTAGPAPALELRNPAGSVTVTAVEGARQVEVRVEALDQAAEQLLDAVEVSAPPTDGIGRLRVVVPDRWLFRTPRFAVAVSTPAGTDARIAVASADLVTRGPLGQVTASTASGDISVERAARLQVRSASGEVRVGTVTGPVTVGTASGDVRVEEATGGLEVRTAAGDVTVSRAAGDIAMTTASGNLGIDTVDRGTVRLKTVSGNARVGIGAGQRVWLELASMSGRLRSELGDDDGSGDGGDPPTVSVSVRTVSGDVRVARAATAAAG